MKKSSDDEACRKAVLLTYAALNKKALQPVILGLAGLTDIADYFVIVSGKTEIQVRAIFQEIEKICKEHKLSIRHTEGETAGSWILVDLQDVVVHIFRQAEREFYDLEKIWKNARRISLPKLGADILGGDVYLP